MIYRRRKPRREQQDQAVMRGEQTPMTCPAVLAAQDFVRKLGNQNPFTHGSAHALDYDRAFRLLETDVMRGQAFVNKRLAHAMKEHNR